MVHNCRGRRAIFATRGQLARSADISRFYLFMVVLSLRCCVFSSCGAWASHYCGFLLLWNWGSVVAAHGLYSVGSVTVAHAPSCPSRGMWDPPGPGSNPCPLYWQVDSLPLSHRGSPGETSDGQGQGRGTQYCKLADRPCSAQDSLPQQRIIWSKILMAPRLINL